MPIHISSRLLFFQKKESSSNLNLVLLLDGYFLRIKTLLFLTIFLFFRPRRLLSIRLLPISVIMHLLKPLSSEDKILMNTEWNKKTLTSSENSHGTTMGRKKTRKNVRKLNKKRIFGIYSNNTLVSNSKYIES